MGSVDFLKKEFILVLKSESLKFMKEEIFL